MDEWVNPLGVVWDTRLPDRGLRRLAHRVGDALLVECASEREAEWPLLLPLPPRSWRAGWYSDDPALARIRFALAPKPLAGAVLGSLVVSSLSPAATFAEGGAGAPRAAPARHWRTAPCHAAAPASTPTPQALSPRSSSPPAAAPPAAAPPAAVSPPASPPPASPPPAAAPPAAAPAAVSPPAAAPAAVSPPAAQPAGAPAAQPAVAPEDVASAPAVKPVAVLGARLRVVRPHHRRSHHRHRQTTPRPAAPPVTVHFKIPARHSAPGRPHTVRAGETLWTIAESRLAPHASSAEIAALTRRIWSANAARIGTGDPDLLPVGVTLRLP